MSLRIPLCILTSMSPVSESRCAGPCWSPSTLTWIRLQTVGPSLSELGLWIFMEACVQMGCLQGEAAFASPDTWRGPQLELLSLFSLRFGGPFSECEFGQQTRLRAGSSVEIFSPPPPHRGPRVPALHAAPRGRLVGRVVPPLP